MHILVDVVFHVGAIHMYNNYYVLYQSQHYTARELIIIHFKNQSQLLFQIYSTRNITVLGLLISIYAHSPL